MPAPASAKGSDDDAAFEMLLIGLRDQHRQLRQHVAALECEVSALRTKQACAEEPVLVPRACTLESPKGSVPKESLPCIEIKAKPARGASCKPEEDDPAPPPGFEAIPAAHHSEATSEERRTGRFLKMYRKGRDRVRDTTSSLTLEPRTGRSEPSRATQRRASGRFRVNRSLSAQELETHKLRGPFEVAPDFNLRRPEEILMFFKSVIVSKGFEVLCGLIILANVVYIGVDTNSMAVDSSRPEDAYGIAHICFSTFFAFELAVRLCTEGRAFYSGTYWRWNMFDTLLVLSGVAEIVVAIFSGFTLGVAGLSAIRLVRVFRTMRLLRTLQFVREFQKMVFGLVEAVKTLACAVLILSFVIYFFAIVFTQTATDYLRKGTIDVGLQDDLEEYFGSLSQSCYSLFLAVSNGISWHYIATPLVEIHMANAVWFLLYICIVLFGVLNVIMSVFVESALMGAQHYKELIIQEKQHEREIAVEHIKEVFKQIDQDRSGSISIDEMEYFLTDTGLKKYIEALDISAADARMFFHLLDRDDSNHIDINEFCEGCLRLQGVAKSFDIHTMIYQVKKFLDKWSDFTMYVEQNLNSSLTPTCSEPDFQSHSEAPSG